QGARGEEGGSRACRVLSETYVGVGRRGPGSDLTQPGANAVQNAVNAGGFPLVLPGDFRGAPLLEVERRQDRPLGRRQVVEDFAADELLQGSRFPSGEGLLGLADRLVAPFAAQQ